MDPRTDGWTHEERTDGRSLLYAMMYLKMLPHHYFPFLFSDVREYPTEILNVDDLLDVAFKKGIMPAMEEEMQKK